MFGNGFFGGLFDSDGDGKLDTFEKAADFGLFVKMRKMKKMKMTMTLMTTTHSDKPNVTRQATIKTANGV